MPPPASALAQTGQAVLLYSIQMKSWKHTSFSATHTKQTSASISTRYKLTLSPHLNSPRCPVHHGSSRHSSLPF